MLLGRFIAPFLPPQLPKRPDVQSEDKTGCSVGRGVGGGQPLYSSPFPLKRIKEI